MSDNALNQRAIADRVQVNITWENEGQRERTKAAAKAANLTVSAFIRDAIEEKISGDKSRAYMIASPWYYPNSGNITIGEIQRLITETFHGVVYESPSTVILDRAGPGLLVYLEMAPNRIAKFFLTLRSGVIIDAEQRDLETQDIIEGEQK